MSPLNTESTVLELNLGNAIWLMKKWLSFVVPISFHVWHTHHSPIGSVVCFEVHSKLDIMKLVTRKNSL